jgi:hypothetical protein
LHEPGKDHFLRWSQVRASQDLRGHKRAVKQAERIEGIADAKSEIGPSFLARSNPKISLLAVINVFRYTWGSDRVHPHGFTKTFLAEGTAGTVPSVF